MSAQIQAQLLNYQEVAELLGVTERHIRHLVSQRRIPFVRWGRVIRFDPQQINSWVKLASVEPRDEPSQYW